MNKLSSIKIEIIHSVWKLKKRILSGLHQTAEVLQDDKGFDGISEKTIVIIGVIVVGAAFIAAMLFLFKDTLIPQITGKIQDLFNIS